MLAQALLRQEQWQQRALQLQSSAEQARALLLLLPQGLEEWCVLLHLLLGRLVVEELLMGGQPLTRPQQHCQLHLQQQQALLLRCPLLGSSLPWRTSVRASLSFAAWTRAPSLRPPSRC